MQRTPLFADHVALGARMVEFAGWEMPIQYKGLKEEHLAVRQGVGLFDVSHMGEIRVKGPQALATLQWLTTNDVAKLKAGEAQYSLLPNEQGGLVDDIIVYCLAENQDYLVCVNASNKDKDFQWMQKNNRGADLLDESAAWGQIAVQGPQALALCQEVLGAVDLAQVKPFRILPHQYRGHQVLIATTGYTGERGCEIFVPAEQASGLWNSLLEVGKKFRVQPIGLGARDTLRTEMCYSLYGHEIDDVMNPYSANLGWVIKPTAKDFLGKAVMLAQREKGLPQKLAGFKMIDKGIPRQGYLLFSFDNREIGRVTSGTHSPSLDEPIGIGYLSSDLAHDGSEFFVEIRGRRVKAKICKTPFVESTSL
ncbi:MAG: glycine cleavage system aminomethyltransferase GcvT [Bdellovibrionales bacterium]|nr:glycine cleavage system aminomethyltransferase GcvT [Bdellovibrionales bacterium]